MYNSYNKPDWWEGFYNFHQLEILASELTLMYNSYKQTWLMGRILQFPPAWNPCFWIDFDVQLLTDLTDGKDSTLSTSLKSLPLNWLWCTTLVIDLTDGKDSTISTSLKSLPLNWLDVQLLQQTWLMGRILQFSPAWSPFNYRLDVQI